MSKHDYKHHLATEDTRKSQEVKGASELVKNVKKDSETV